MIHVDVLVLSRDSSPLRPDVLRGLATQRGVQLHLYRIIGRKRATDRNRYETIARARSRATQLGQSPWVMFVDDDVLLESECVAELINGLSSRPTWGAIAADYLGQSEGQSSVTHVSMGATVFRRNVLRQLRFRWEDGKCECRCCCDDLAKRGWSIGYLAAARARHLSVARACGRQHDPSQVAEKAGSVVLTAVDWRHVDRLRELFLRSYVATGNKVPIVVCSYGLAASEWRPLANHPAVADVIQLPGGTKSPGIRRCQDFQPVLARLPGKSPVAFWDAGDILFQSNIDPLWKLVARNPSKLLVVREPASHRKNPALINWTARIANLSAREQILRQLAPRPFLNGGFAAGTAEAMLEYLQFAERFLDRLNLESESTADQLALNAYCYSNENRWRHIDEGWNYCLAFRPKRHCRPRCPEDADWHRDLANLPRVVNEKGSTVPVVHGNGHTLETLLKRWWSRGSWRG